MASTKMWARRAGSGVAAMIDTGESSSRPGGECKALPFRLLPMHSKSGAGKSCLNHASIFSSRLGRGLGGRFRARTVDGAPPGVRSMAGIRVALQTHVASLKSLLHSALITLTLTLVIFDNCKLPECSGAPLM